MKRKKSTPKKREIFNKLGIENSHLILDQSLDDNLKKMSLQDLNDAYNHIAKSVEKLYPTSSHHIAPIPYGVAYTRSKAFDIMCTSSIGIDTIEPEDLLAYLLDPNFLTKKYRGYLEKLNENLIKQHNIEKITGNHRIQIFTAVREYMLSVALSKAWERYRFVFIPDQEFTQHLLATDDFEFSSDVLTYLPSDSFFLDYKNITNIETRGVFITIDSDDKYVYVYAIFIEDDYPEKNLGFAFGSKIQGQTIITKLLKHQTLKFSEWLTQEGVAYQIVPGKHFFNKQTMVINQLDLENGPIIRMLTLKLLMYLSSKNPDLQMDKYWKKQKSRLERLKKDTNNIPEEWDIGARYGDVIRHNKKKQHNNESNNTNGTHKRPKAHIRSAHFHLYWTGKNKTIPEIKFLSPITINGDNIIPVIRKVTDAEPKGSFGEELIKEELINKGYDFKREKYIREIKKRFDFEVIYRGQHLFIEFDGEQHFKPVPNWDGQKGLEERRESDALKNQYCINNNIPLLRIRFDQKPEISKLINTFFENPTIGQWNSLITNDEYYEI